MLVRVIVALSALAILTVAISAPVASYNLSCAIVGDSIAVGAGKYLRSCKLNAKIGIPSGAIIARIDPSADINVISAGSNDPDNPALNENLERIRERANRAIWILPAVPNAREAVRKVAARHGDPIVSFTPSRDQVHPHSENALAQAIDAAIARSAEAAPDSG
jgi:hypothetical protein